ncbi:OLC1v1008997C2 [Oldenlandia corymbosa var. corymbosa]|uniref:shikimate kinase n=1 Tax=Oldenlandia corymbosa var. corymbosa TaxID=529605 RepID=A0AAV1DMU5_OLDCO|nr:OLC1v1008997C2 [Oldenlandia corymbosa var. corymbosa]
MDAKVAQSLHWSTWRSSDNIVRRHGGSLHFSQRQSGSGWKNFQTIVSYDLGCRKGWNGQKSVVLKVSCSSQKTQASVLQSESALISVDEAALLKNKAEDVGSLLEGRCIYLVGMMGSGKTTVGRILSESLNYSFFDCDTLIEQTVGGITVAEIFKLYGESFFRNNETEVLQKVSSMQRLVVSTGGGAVVRPINWKYMHKGLSVWLDVPLEALARRIAEVGTDSRPLLSGESGDAYTQAFKRLTTLLEERGEAYANANARVSLEDMAVKYGCEDVCKLTPATIAVEALVQLENYLKKEGTRLK